MAPIAVTTVGGRHIGHDGFVVPKNLDEFHERFPEYVRDWVGRHADRSTPKEDFEDWDARPSDPHAIPARKSEASAW